MKFQPRDYQNRGTELIRNSFRNGKKRVLCVAPPGAGKGTMIAYQAAVAARNGKRVLIFMHKRELVVQQAQRIIDQMEYTRIGFYLSGMKQIEHPIMVGTVQTMTKRKIRTDFDLVILDECHRIKTTEHQKIVELFPNKFFIGFTATPFRTDKKGFKDDFDDIIQFTTYGELVNKKALVPTKVIAPVIAPELDGVHTRLGDYVDSELYERYNEERIYRGVVERWLAHADGMKTIVFNVNSKDHSRQTAEWFQKYGVDARAIDSDTPKEVRRQLLHDFQTGKYPVLCNIGLFTEGISIDDTQCIVFNVATKSATKWVQAAARGSRPVWENGDWKKNPDGTWFKPYCLILDFGSNAERHGYIDDYDIIPFDLSGTPPKNGEAATKKCPVCEAVVYTQTRTCKCGYVFEVITNAENKVFSDEVEWEVVNRAQALMLRFEKMTWNQLQNQLTPANVRTIAKIRGYKPAWACFMAWKKGWVESWMTPHKKENIPTIINILKEHEANSGMHLVYQQLEQGIPDEPMVEWKQFQSLK